MFFRLKHIIRTVIYVEDPAITVDPLLPARLEMKKISNLY